MVSFFTFGGSRILLQSNKDTMITTKEIMNRNNIRNKSVLTFTLMI